jgi:tetratricopeptide (TPR) repeat protein
VTARPGSLDLPHRAYIEALADAPEGSAAWHAIVAGYATLQLFESWMDGGVGTAVPSMLDVRRVRRYVEAVPHVHPGRRCLTRLVDCIEAARADVESGGDDDASDRRAAVGRVLASYAKLLQYDAQWGLVADVHGTLVEFAQRTDDVPRMLDSMLMRGYGLRMQGRFVEATDAYAALRAAAIAAGDERYRLESQLSDAKVAIDHGNFPMARELLDRAIEEARRVDCAVIVSKGLTDRARVAAMQGEHDLALACSYEALEVAEDGADRERILTNIALTFAQMGLRDAARDAALLVAATAQDRNTRLTALVNLMELAHLDGRELAFEQYRRELSREELSPYLEAVYCEVCAEGFAAFGRASDARHAARRMLEVAERHGLNELVIKAESLLDSAERRPSGPPAAPRALTPQTRKIARAIARMRGAAGLPG